MIVIILAAILLQVISAIQYHSTRVMLERNLEERVLTQLIVSNARMDGIMGNVESLVYNQTWHIQQNLDNPEYLETLVYNLVRNDGNIIVGAAIAFRPNYYADRGYWYEPYAREINDSIVLEQIGSAQHDYTSMDIYQQGIKGDTLKWTTPYLDAEGAQAVVTTFALPIRDRKGEPIAVMGVDVTTGWISETVNNNRTAQQPSSFSLVLSPEGQLIAYNDSLCSETLATQIVKTINDSTVQKEIRENDRIGQVKKFDFYEEEKGRSGCVYYASITKEPKWQIVKVFYHICQMGTNKMPVPHPRLTIHHISGSPELTWMSGLFFV